MLLKVRAPRHIRYVSVSHVTPEDMLRVQIIQHPCPPTNPAHNPLSGGSLSCRGVGNNKKKPEHKQWREPPRAKNNGKCLHEYCHEKYNSSMKCFFCKEYSSTLLIHVTPRKIAVTETTRKNHWHVMGGLEDTIKGACVCLNFFSSCAFVYECRQQSVTLFLVWPFWIHYVWQTKLFSIQHICQLFSLNSRRLLIQNKIEN